MTDPILSLDLACGRTIRARRLLIDQTYSGLVEGLPSEALNRRIVREAGRSAASLFGHDERVVLEPRPAQRSARGRIWPQLPALTVSALFTSPVPASDPECHGSSLVLVWFQEGIDPLPDAAARRRIEELDWARHAVDYLL